MQRPSEIIWFERIIFMTLPLGVVDSWLWWPVIVQRVGPLVYLVAQFIAALAMIVLTLLISRRRSNFAKWLSVTQFLFVVPWMAKLASEGKLTGSSLILIAQTLGQLVAFALLFTQASRAWFKSPDLQSVFD